MKKLFWIMSILVLVVSIFVVIGVRAVDSDPCYQNADPGVCQAIRANQLVLTPMSAGIRNTLLQTYVPAPKPSPTPQPTATWLMSTDIIRCSFVITGTSVSETVQRANNGEWPPYTFAGAAMLVRIDHKGVNKVIRELQDEILNGNEVVAPGDRVCIALQKAKLEKLP